MPYQPKDDPFSDYAETGDKAQTGNLSSQATRESVIAPAAGDFTRYAKAIEVTSEDGLPVQITYLPMRNGDGETVTKWVPSGWVSRCAIRAVTAAVSAGSAAIIITRFDD